MIYDFEDVKRQFELVHTKKKMRAISSFPLLNSVPFKRLYLKLNNDAIKIGIYSKTSALKSEFCLKTITTKLSL